MKTIIMNTAILLFDGDYRLEAISLKEAKELLKDGFLSAVGHQSTADVLTSLLGVDIPMNRITLTEENFQDGQVCLVLKLKSRPPEGKILSIEEIEKIGYEFKRLIKKGE